MKVLALLVVAVVMLQMLTEGDASECCRPKPGWTSGQVTLNCNDCKAGTPYCGVGRCNIWGCNCDGGCRTGTCGGLFSAEQVYDEADYNKDGKLSTEEAHNYLTAVGVHSHHAYHMIGTTDLQASEGFLPLSVITTDEKYDTCAGPGIGSDPDPTVTPNNFNFKE